MKAWKRMAVEYHYFARPHDFSTFKPEPRRCDLCGERRAGYDAGGFLGRRDVDVVCEVCLSSGRVQDAGIITNDGDSTTLCGQLAQMRRDLSEEAIKALADERTAELEGRTPHVPTWQYLLWPAHCGDYCRYLKEVGQPEIVSLAPDGDGPAFLVAHTPDIDDIEHACEVWKDIRPDAPQNLGVTYSVGAYLFQCLTCGEYVLLWDCD